MAGTSVLVSGAYNVSDTTGIAAFLTWASTNNCSGANVFIIPTSNGLQCNVGIIQRGSWI
jgi:hypothetical protein